MTLMMILTSFLTHSHSHTLAHTHSHTDSHTDTHSRSLTLIHTHSPSLTLSHSLTHTKAQWHKLILTHTHSFSHSLTHSLTYLLTHSHTHTLTYSHTHTITHPHSLSLTHTLSHSLLLFFTHSHSLALTHTFTHSHSHSHTLIHSHTHPLEHPHTHTPTHSHTHSLFHTHRHTQVLDIAQRLPREIKIQHWQLRACTRDHGRICVRTQSRSSSQCAHVHELASTAPVSTCQLPRRSHTRKHWNCSRTRPLQVPSPWNPSRVVNHTHARGQKKKPSPQEVLFYSMTSSQVEVRSKSCRTHILNFPHTKHIHPHHPKHLNHDLRRTSDDFLSIIRIETHYRFGPSSTTRVVCSFLDAKFMTYCLDVRHFRIKFLIKVSSSLIHFVTSYQRAVNWTFTLTII